MAITIHLRGDVPILEPNGKIVGPAVSALRKKLALWSRRCQCPIPSYQFRACLQDG